MNTEKIHITDKTKNYDSLTHPALRSDIEMENIFDTYLLPVGKVLCSPETWEIECQTPDGELVDGYLYDIKYEYEQDLAILRGEAVKGAMKPTENPHDLIEKGRKYDKVKKQRDSCIEALKTISKATGGVINDLEKRLDDIEVIANGAIKSTE